MRKRGNPDPNQACRKTRKKLYQMVVGNKGVVSGIKVCSFVNVSCAVSRGGVVGGPVRIRHWPSLRPFGACVLSYVSGWLGGGFRVYTSLLGFVSSCVQRWLASVLVVSMYP